MPLMDSFRLDTFSSARTHLPQPATHHALLDRAKALEPKDRLLLQLTFEKNLTVRQIAQILERPAGTVSRRLHRLCRRLRDPLVTALLDQRCVLSAEYRTLGIQYFAQGKLIAELAQARGLSIGQIRAMLNFVRGWHKGVHLQPQAISN